MALVTVDDLVDYMSGISLTTAQRVAAQWVIDGVQRGLERRLARKFETGVYTERVFGDEEGWAAVRHTPLISVQTIDGVAQTTQPDMTKNGVYVSPKGWSTVSYTAGMGATALDPSDLEDVRLAIMEKAAGVMTVRHDDTLTVKDLDTRDAVEQARRAATTWSDDEIKPFERLRRRVVI